MAGMTTIFRKELADHLGSRRIAVISTIIILASLSAVLSAVESPTLLQQDSAALFLSLLTERSGNLPSFLFFVTFLVPILGILLGFDAINAERQRGTLSLLISQPVYRDALINGKFLAALAAMALMMGGILALIGGISMAKLGIAPNGAEILRALVFFGAAMLYASFWLSVAILFSVLFDKTSTSALAAIALWIFLAFFVQLVAGVVADLARDAGLSIEVEEARIPISPTARHAAEMLGLDPLTIANEGKLVAVVAEADAERLIAVCRRHAAADAAAVIGTVVDQQPAMAELVRNMKGRYEDRYVFLDAPSVLDGADVLVLAPLVDHILFVVRAGSTPLPEARRALEMLPREKVIGVVLNRQTGP